MNEKLYIGGGVCVSYVGFQIVLSLENFNDIIYISEEVFKELVEYGNKCFGLKYEIKEQGD